MRLTKGRRKFASCQHSGFGKFCHRCMQAEQLEKKGKEPQEVARLRGTK